VYIVQIGRHATMERYVEEMNDISFLEKFKYHFPVLWVALGYPGLSFTVGSVLAAIILLQRW
jgi:hypothetical protein